MAAHYSRPRIRATDLDEWRSSQTAGPFSNRTTRVPEDRCGDPLTEGLKDDRSWLERALTVGLIAAVLAGIGVFVAQGISRHVTVDVRNDSARAVRIASCVDDAADVNSGEVFTAEGSPPNDRLPCLVTYGSAPSQCLAIPQVKSVKRTVALSQLVRVSDS
jgi:hypothetical protein